MIQKTKGIVINYIKYQESSIIVKIFTEEFGLASFIVNGIRSARSKKSIGYFQPFSILELLVYLKETRSIHRISEYKYFMITPSLSQNIRKSSIAVFLCEVLSKMLSTEQGPQKDLFEYLLRAIVSLDEMKQGIENFHLHLLLKIAPFMGFGLEDGKILLSSMEKEIEAADDEVVRYISGLMDSETGEGIPATSSLRFKTLELILEYYQHHGAHIGEIKSLKVLHQVFNT